MIGSIDESSGMGCSRKYFGPNNCLQRIWSRCVKHRTMWPVGQRRTAETKKFKLLHSKSSSDLFYSVCLSQTVHGKLSALCNQTILSCLCGAARSLPEIPDSWIFPPEWIYMPEMFASSSVTGPEFYQTEASGGLICIEFVLLLWWHCWSRGWWSGTLKTVCFRVIQFWWYF